MRSTAKSAIHASFRTMLLSKSLDRITVRDIVEDCGLTRNTFYYHYEDIYDLFDDYLDTRMHEAWQTLPEGSAWDTILVRLLDCVCETPQMGRHIFFSRKREAMLQYLNKVVTAIIERYLTQNMQDLTLAAEDQRLVCDTCCHALYGMIEKWLTGPDAPLLKSYLKRLTNCFAGAIRGALQYCAANPRKEDLP